MARVDFTTTRILARYFGATGGEVVFDGEPVRFTYSDEAEAPEIIMIHP